MTLFEEAIRFAVEKHSGQVRKLRGSPYILHPLEVASIVGTMSTDEELLCAAVLHDTVEDTDTTLEEIEEKFGRRVRLLVLTETEDKRADLPPAATWKLRKEEALAIVQHTKDIQVKMLWLGDKLSNMRSFYREYLRQGSALWNNMNQKDPAMQAWYYAGVLRALSELSGYEAYKEYKQLTMKVFEDYREVFDEA